MPEPGKAINPFWHEPEQLVIPSEWSRPAVIDPVGLAHHLVDVLSLCPAGCEVLDTGPASRKAIYSLRWPSSLECSQVVLTLPIEPHGGQPCIAGFQWKVTLERQSANRPRTGLG